MASRKTKRPSKGKKRTSRTPAKSTGSVHVRAHTRRAPRAVAKRRKKR